MPDHQGKRRSLDEILEARIRAGDPPPGGRLPSRHDLAEEYDVGETKVFWALQILKRRGLVRGYQGQRGLEVRPEEDWAPADPQ